MRKRLIGLALSVSVLAAVPVVANLEGGSPLATSEVVRQGPESCDECCEPMMYQICEYCDEDDAEFDCDEKPEEIGVEP